LCATEANDDAMKHVAAFARLEWLDLWHTSVTDAGLERLAALKGLRDLNLNDTKVTDAGLEQLGKMTSRSCSLLQFDSIAVTILLNLGLRIGMGIPGKMRTSSILMRLVFARMVRSVSRSSSQLRSERRRNRHGDFPQNVWPGLRSPCMVGFAVTTEANMAASGHNSPTGHRP